VRIFLSGPMGSGKSTVARVLASRLGVDALDLDALIAERAGATIEEIFRSRGEAAFRGLEREEVRRVAERHGDCVVALGGGTVTDTVTRRQLLGAGTLVTLTAPVEVLTGRVATETGRPLLAGGDARGVLEALLRDRAAAYAECHGVVDTAGLSPAGVAERAREIAERAPIVVPLGTRTYRVDVGPGVRASLPRSAAAAAPGRVALVVTDGGAQPWAEPSAQALEAEGWSTHLEVLPAGEEHKTLASVERLWDAALDAALDRDSLLVAVGGGVVGDLAGFAAATIYRGVPVVQMPTTLLSMVDSAVGGKTGFDRPQGKNLVGAFHQPAAVLCDVETLSTLPAAERVAGLAEVVKSAWLEGEEAVAALEGDAEGLRAGDPAAITSAIRMSVRLKARIVTEDEREGGARRLLNLGHTVGHAIEAAAGYRGVRHGEAVALGLVAAFRVAAGLGRDVAGHAERMERLLGALGLPTDLDRHLGTETLAFVGTDKKRSGDRVRFVVPEAPGCVEVRTVALDELAPLLERR